MNTIRLLLPLILISTFTSIAQRKNNPNLPVVLNQRPPVECGTPTPPLKVVQQHEKLMQQFIQRGSNLTPSVVIPIKAHIVRKSNGTGGLTVDSLNSAIAVMNTKYASINMSFTLCSSIHYIDSDELYTLDVDTEDGKLVLNNVNDAINVYFVGSLVAGSSILNGISAFPSASPAENRIIMWNAATNNRITLPHEMGHYWNVFHTHEEFYGKELVDGSNCSTAGDLVCDTPADPCCYFYDSNTCTYTGIAKDANEESYTPMVNNLMSYYGLCRDIFTAGQYTRIEAGYALRKSYMGPDTYTMACNATAAAAPTNINVTQVNCGINITWTDNANNEMGYIIEAATSPSGPFVAVGSVGANTTSFSDTRSFVNGIIYYYRVVAANSNATLSSVAQIIFHSTIACYCTPPILDCNDSDVITNVKIEKGASIVLNHSSECSENGFSVDSTALPILEKGITYTFSMTNASSYQEGAVAWVDYNRNGIFESNEVIFTKENALWNNASGSFTIPLSAIAGEMRMRISLTYESNPTDPCTPPAMSQNYGEIEDYWINIQCGLDNVAGATRCGSGSVTLSASGCSGGSINWFTAATGGTVIATGGTYNTPVLSAPKTYYVACASGACSVNRSPVTATIIQTNISFTNPSEPAGTFLATQTITSTTDIATVTNYFAGKSIILNPGFQAGTNEVFTASIQNISCP